MNFFEYYDLEASLEIDEKILKNAYYTKMRALHPDMHMQASDADKEDLLAQSSFNNKAFNTLKDFHLRLQYILDTFSEKTENKKTLPPSFLMEMMDVNEEVMELQFDFSAEKAQKIKRDILDQESASLETLNTELKDLKIEFPIDNAVSDKIGNYLMKRNYLKRIIENIEKLA